MPEAACREGQRKFGQATGHRHCGRRLGEENYAFLAHEEIHALEKYGTYHKEKSRAWKKDISKIDNWSYNEEEDSWTCVAGQKLTFHYESKTATERGYEIRTRHYWSASCEGCPLKAACTKAKGNLEISVSLTYWRQKNEMRERLRSEDGYALSVRRTTEPESVFGHMKNNRGFRRFLLRGLDKVSLEVGWLCLAHNLFKKVAIDQKRKRDEAEEFLASSRLTISASFQLFISTSEGLLGQLLSVCTFA